METLGEYLKAKREEKGLTLKEVADRTRISMTFLQALEDGDYKVIPGEVFVSGFLRSYAKELGLKQKDVMARYRDSGAAEQFEQTEPPKPATEYLPGRVSKRRPVPARLLYVVFAAVVVTGAIYFIAGREEPLETVPAKPAPVAVPVKKAPEPPIQAPVTTVSTMPARTTVTTPTAKPVPAKPKLTSKKPVYIILKATSTSWYSVRIDGASRKSGLVKTGEEVIVEADREILLDVGNAGGVEIEYRGKTTGPLGPKSTVKRNIRFTKDGNGR